MKLAFLAAALVLLPAALPAFAQELPAGPEQSLGKKDLLNRIEIWRAQHLPHLTPPAKITVELEPRLDVIKGEVEAAATDAALVKPRREMAAWEKDFARLEYPIARAQGQTRGNVSQYYVELSQQAEFAATVHALMQQDAVQRALVQTQQKLLSAAAQNPSLAYDGARNTGRVSAGASVVVVPPPAPAGDPSRYAKVRQILVSQGASAQVVDMAIQEAIRQKADPLLVLSVISAESQFKTHATSSCGARGLMQIMPGTGYGLGVHDAGMLYDAQTNLHAGIRFLKSLCSEFSGGEMNPFTSSRVQSAVAAYNAGPTAVHRFSGVPPYHETQGYVRNVLGYYNQFKRYLTA